MLMGAGYKADEVAQDHAPVSKHLLCEEGVRSCSAKGQRLFRDAGYSARSVNAAKDLSPFGDYDALALGACHRERQ